MAQAIPRRPVAADAPAATGHRPVRSFVRREGRITVAQERALTELWPRFGLELPQAPPNYSGIFARRAPLRMEIGFGNGEALIDMAARAPEADFIGVEVHRPGVGRLLLALENAGLDNVRVYCDDVQDVLTWAVAPGTLDALYVFFPDPWPKKRHHKRRLLQPAFVHQAALRLRPGGVLHVATDWADYAQWALDVLGAEPLLINTATGGGAAPRPQWRTHTRFEARGERLGHEVSDLIFRRREHDQAV